ncbi:MAG: hypothetical protein ABS976_23920, partial [Rhodococcus sp. (in: high G+C Gram-positive bacteria)]
MDATSECAFTEDTSVPFRTTLTETAPTAEGTVQISIPESALHVVVVPPAVTFTSAPSTNKVKTSIVSRTGDDSARRIIGDTDEAFLFTLTLTPEITGSYGGVYVEGGQVRLWLKNNESVTLKGIPVGTTYTVS